MVTVLQPLGTSERECNPLLAISNAMVRLHKEAFGRGPTKSRAAFAGSDMLVVLLEDGFTAAERNLLALGEADRLRETRLLIQRRLEPHVRQVVEETLGRHTRAVVTGVDTDHDVVMHVCALEPNGDGAHAEPEP